MEFMGNVTSDLEEWPTSKLRRNIECDDSCGSQLPLAVLLTTGSLNPIHAGHLQCMEDARVAIEKLGYHVVAGYISPSSDYYVRGKMERIAHENRVTLNSIFASATHRLRLTQLACMESEWLNCSSWEANQPRFADFDEVTYALETFLRHNGFFSSEHDAVFYVCGSDHYNKCGLYRGVCARQDGKYRRVAVCVRDGEGGADRVAPPASPLVTIVSTSSSLNEGSSAPGRESDDAAVSTSSLSSTLIRAILNKEPTLGGVFPPEEDAALRAALPSHVYSDLTVGEGITLYRK
jgi:nicotinic acid mononucleotide adenylyltransferase